MNCLKHRWRLSEKYLFYHTVFLTLPTALVFQKDVGMGIRCNVLEYLGFGDTLVLLNKISLTM